MYFENVLEKVIKRSRKRYQNIKHTNLVMYILLLFSQLLHQNCPQKCFF